MQSDLLQYDDVAVSILIVNKNDFKQQRYRKYWGRSGQNYSSIKLTAIKHINYGRKYYCILIDETTDKTININNINITENAINIIHTEADKIARRDYYKKLYKMFSIHRLRSKLKKGVFDFCPLYTDLKHIVMSYV